MGKRANNEGSVFRRKGRWVAAVTFPDGRRRERTAKTQRDALLRLKELREYAASDRRHPSSSEKTVGTYTEGWLHRNSRQWKTNTAANYESYLLRHIAPYPLSRIRLQNLTDRDIERWVDDMEQSGVGGRTRQATFHMLGRVFRDARKRRILLDNPMELVLTPKANRRTLEIPTPEESRLFLEATKIDSALHALTSTLLNTGMRIGEALALTWRDVDFDKCEIRVRNTLVEKRGRLRDGESALRLHPPKTSAGRRVIIIPPSEVETLRSQRSRIGAVPHPDRPIFANERGGWLRQGNLLRRAWHPAWRRAGLSPRGFHSLRHAHASLLLSAGVGYAAVAARLGHANAGITYEIYAHTLPGDDSRAAAEIEKVLAG